jgi:benzodiazapine receptor
VGICIHRFRPFLGPAVWIGLCFVVMLTGSLFTRPSIPNWYAALHKPAWTPPNWLFGPVWLILYLLMGLAAWLVWKERRVSKSGVPLTLFLGQLFLNLLWSYLFFGLQMPQVAFAEIGILWLMILTTTLTFWQVKPLAGILFLPYLVWVAYAGILNLAIWRMNLP